MKQQLFDKEMIIEIEKQYRNRSTLSGKECEIGFFKFNFNNMSVEHNGQWYDIDRVKQPYNYKYFIKK